EPMHRFVARVGGQRRERRDLASEDLLAPRARRPHDAPGSHGDAPARADHVGDLGSRGSFERGQDGDSMLGGAGAHSFLVVEGWPSGYSVMGRTISAGSPAWGGNVAACARRTMQSTVASSTARAPSGITERTLPFGATRILSERVTGRGTSSCSVQRQKQ